MTVIFILLTPRDRLSVRDLIGESRTQLDQNYDVGGHSSHYLKLIRLIFI
jgi:hypothetical protein